MSDWTPDELTRIGRADELRIASRRPDGSLRPFITIWAVHEGDDLYVRSAHGYDNPWFQRALHSGQGRIQAGGIERDVAFQEPEPDAAARVHGRVPREIRSLRSVDRRDGRLRRS